MRLNTSDSVEGFIGNLDRSTAVKTARAIELLEEFGSNLRMPYSKKVSDNVFELRIRGQQEVRIFYCFHNNMAYLLHGYIKKSQKTPTKELKLAQTKYKFLTRI